VEAVKLLALIFDFDGLIFDSETSEFEAFAELYAEHGLELRLSDWQKGVGTWQGFDPWEPFGGLPDEERRELVDRYRQRLHQRLEAQELLPGVRQLIAQAKQAGLRLAIASSSDRSWIQRWFGKFGLLQDFEVISTRDQVAAAKPDPALYRLALDRLGVDAQQALALEDSLHGTRAALAAGLLCVVVTNPVTRDLPFPAEALRLPSLEGGLPALQALWSAAGR
jgi:HAD superfamily hydrolase (TIGR01509 family)